MEDTFRLDDGTIIFAGIVEPQVPNIAPCASAIRKVMKYFYIEPEVAGGLGKNTLMDRSVHPPIVRKLHYELDGWLGDVLLESFPCWMITIAAKERLKAAALTGATFAEVEVTTSQQFRDLYPSRPLPTFVWLKVQGVPGQSDFGIDPKSKLVVSERALSVLQELGIAHAVVEEFNG